QRRQPIELTRSITIGRLVQQRARATLIRIDTAERQRIVCRMVMDLMRKGRLRNPSVQAEAFKDLRVVLFEGKHVLIRQVVILALRWMIGKEIADDEIAV